MANELKHKDPGSELTQAEFIATDGHAFDSQATGDILYASSSTVLSRLAKGSDGNVLELASGLPAWTASPTIGSTSWCNAGHAHAASNSGGTVCANVLAGTTLKSCVVTSSLTTVGALNSGSIACGFGAIDNGSSTITTTGLISGGSLDIDNVLINGTTIGHTCDTDLITVGDQSVTIAGDLAISGGCITLTGAATDVDLIDNNACALSFDASGQAGILAIDTQNCAEGVKMSGKLTVTGAISTTGAVTVGACDTGLDVKFFGASAGAFMLYDQSCDQLEIRGASADAATSTGKLLLTTALTNINACDVIGSINFQAPLEAGGTDAVAIAAGIRAVAQATFTCAVNATDLIFYTGHSEAAAERFRFTSQNEIGIAGANYGTDGQVLTSGGAGAAVAWECAGGGGGSSALQVNDSVAVALGTGSDSKLYYDGTDTHWDLRDTGTGDLVIALAACHPSPDAGTVHIWEGNAGSVTASADMQLVIEHSGNAGIGILSPANAVGQISFGSPTDNRQGGVHYNHCGDVMTLRTANADRVKLIGGITFVNDSANGQMTTGLTLNQGAADNTIFALKSSDVNTGLTSLTGQDVEVDDYAIFKKSHSTKGGLVLYGLNSCNTRALDFYGYAGADNTGKSTTASANNAMSAIRHDNSNALAAFACDANIFMLEKIDSNGGAARFIWDVEGTAHADVGVATYDDYCDIELLRGFLATTCDQYKANYVDKFGQDLMYNQQWYEDNKLIGKCSIHYETRSCGRIQQRAMVNFTGLAMLHHSTILQMADRFSTRLDSLETQLKALTEGK
jgi:hypothetical protein